MLAGWNLFHWVKLSAFMAVSMICTGERGVSLAVEEGCRKAGVKAVKAPPMRWASSPTKWLSDRSCVTAKACHFFLWTGMSQSCH